MPEGTRFTSPEAKAEVTAQEVGVPSFEVSPLTSPELEDEALTEEVGVPALQVSPLTVPTDSPHPSPWPQSTPTCAPRPGSAILQGVLFLMNPVIVAPREDGLYLVRIDEEAPMAVPTVNSETSLQATVDEVTGRFLFLDVPPGLYALVAVTDNGQQFSIRKFQTGEASILTVGDEELDRVVDLGTLRLP